MAVAVLGRRAYVANRGTDNLSVIEARMVVAVVPVGDAPVALVADDRSGLVYVVNEGDHSLSIVWGDRVIKTVETAKDPACVALANGRVYVGGRGSNELMVHDASSGDRITTLTVPGSVGILALAVNPERQLLYASVYDAVQIVDLERLVVIGTVQVGVYVTLGADPATGRFFCAAYDSQANTHDLVAFDALGQQELGRVRIGGDPRGIALDRIKGRIYVANSFTNDLSVIDADSLQTLATVTVGLRPGSVAAGLDREVYVACPDADSVAVVDAETTRLVGAVPVCHSPGGMAVDEPSDRLYVALPGGNAALILSDDTIRELAVGVHPAELALSDDGERLFVLNHVSGDLAVLATNDGRIIGRTSVGTMPQALVVAPENGRLIASDAVFDAEGLIKIQTIPILSVFDKRPVQPVSVQVDGSKGLVYAVASNGVPGSNSGLLIYVLDLATGQRLDKQLGGFNTTAIALDERGQSLYSVASRMNTHRLFVDDLGGSGETVSVTLPNYPVALAHNPTTSHLFICLSPTVGLADETKPELLVLDSRGLGTVARLTLPSASTHLYRYTVAVDSTRNRIYVGDAQTGSVHVVQDVELSPPPAPTPSVMVTPWPTLTARP